MKSLPVLFVLILASVLSNAVAQSLLNVRVMPAAITDSTVTITWDKTNNVKTNKFTVFKNGKKVGFTTRSYFRVRGLIPHTKYSFTVLSGEKTSKINVSNKVNVSTGRISKIFDITAWGAAGDATTLNTKSIQSAIDSCPPGGVIYIPKGTFISGALFIRKSDITIFLDKDATLKASADPENFPMIPSRYEGFNRKIYSSLITCGSISGPRISNIRIVGRGTIDGQGEILSAAETNAKGRTTRSHGLLLQNCDNIYLADFTIQNSPTWCIHPIYCNHLTTENVMIKTDGYGVDNADGWDPDSSTDCYIVGSEFWTHDDCIAIKSGADEEGRKIGKPSEDIYIRYCIFHKGGGLALGSEMSGGIRRVFVSDCNFESVDRGINIKTRRKRGGVIEDIVIKNIRAERFGSWGINLDMRYNKGSLIPKQSKDATPIFRNISFENIRVKYVNGPAILVSGLPESRIENIMFKDISIGEAKAGGKVDTCSHVLFQNVDFKTATGPLWLFSDTIDLKFVDKVSTCSLVDPSATSLTKVLYQNLHLLSGKHVLFGQQDATSSGYGWKDNSGRSDIKEVTGSYPAFYSWDFMDFTLPGADTIEGEAKIRKLTVQAYQRGGVNSYCWHFFNPITNKNFYDTMRVVGSILPGGAYYNKYIYELNKIGKYVKTLKGSKGELIPIIFRLYHEMDGSWFWWGKNFCTADEYKKLYQFTVSFLRDSLHVHNIIYAFSPDCKFNSEQEYLERYPGDDYVDVIGMDNYWDFRNKEGNLDLVYKKLMIISDYALRKNKLAALTETGQKNVEDSCWFTQKLLKVLRDYPEKPNLAYVAVWRNSVRGYYTPFKGHPAEQDFVHFKANPYVLFEDNMPNLYKLSTSTRQ